MSEFGDGWFVDTTKVGDCTVSAVFHGAPRRDGRAVLFETAIFATNGKCEIAGEFDAWDEAKRGHAEIARALRVKGMH